MPELPDHLAKVLAELEARKESLRNRLDSLDTAIDGIHGLQAASQDLSTAANADQHLTDARGDHDSQRESSLDLPRREQVGEILRAVGPEPPPSERRDFILQYDNPNSPAESPKPIQRPSPVSTPERRKAEAPLNVYVNQNSEWASRQFVAPHSPRAIFRHKTGHRCPKCGSQDTRISTTRGIADCFMFLFDYSLARCRNCDRQFRIWRSREEEDEQEHDLDAHPSTE